MSVTIDVQNDDSYLVDGLHLKEAARVVLSRHAVEAAEMTVVITSNEAVQALNKQHRQIDAPTDVLSFPADPLPPEISSDEAPYLGDLVIAFPYAKAQAEREGHAMADSLALLVVHGTLHLLGYDHDTPENRAAMWDKQAEVLQILEISPAIVPALENRI